jgi:ketosteroid isomerase-like protein
VTLHPLLARQIELIEAGDLENLLDQYTDDALLVRFDRVAAGRGELRDLFAAYLAQSPRVRRVEQHAGAGDALAYEAVLDVGGREVRGYGAFVLRDGRIWRQFATVIG